MPQAMTIMQNRNRSKDEIVRLGQQLLHYNASIAPFCQQKGGADFVPRMWWSALLGGDKVDMIRALAMMLFDVVPHSAATERTFSIAGWMHSKTRNRMSVSTTGKLAAIKLHYNAQRPSLPPRRSQAAAEKRKMARAAAGDDLHEAAIERGEVELIEPIPLDEHDVSEEGDVDEMIDALEEAFDEDGRLLGDELDDADAAEAAAARAAAEDAAARKVQIYSLGVQALQKRLLSCWPGVDLTSSKLHPPAAAAIAVNTTQSEQSALGTSTEVVDIDALLTNMLG
jgi:hypothetical protein